MAGETQAKKHMQIRALALFSGGLDSTLAAKIILDQGLRVEAAHFVNAFLPGHGGNGQKDSCLTRQRRIAEQLGIKLHIVDISQAHLRLVQNPRYGYGKNRNPCIDCRILMLKEAKAYMQKHGFSFLVSGEVLGQRPMSQRKDALHIVERDAFVQGLLLRPLCAKLLPPTLPEGNSWVDRAQLFNFSGRSRKPQLALAKKFAIKEYLTPAGGCLLTQAEFARKFSDLCTCAEVDLDNVQLLKVGRHFRYGSQAKIVVGRNDEENKCLLDLIRNEDILFKMRDFTGPITIARLNGKTKQPCLSSEGILGLIETAARLTARYSKARDEEMAWVDYWLKSSGENDSILVSTATEELIEKMRI